MSSLTVSESPSFEPRRLGLTIALWVVQVVLAGLFLLAGIMKSAMPLETLAENMPWVGYSPWWIVRLVGVSELLGAVGLILPAATRIWPSLTAWAAVGLATVMALAIGMHAWHAEWSGLPVNFVLGALAAFVAWGRFTRP